MKKFVLPIVAVLIITVGVFAVSCTTDDLQNLLEVAQSTAGLESLVVVILAVEEALEITDVTDTLADGSEVLTVFAPNNAAFIALFEAIEQVDENNYTVDEDGNGIIDDTDIGNFLGSLVSLGLADTTEEAVEFVGDVLSLHVISDQKLMASDVIAADGGEIGPTDLVIDSTAINLGVSVVDNTVTLTPDSDTSTAADIAATDVEASNGVAHVLSGVLLPLSLDF
jgi:uncharacterized surface protein with fasciclin (FAS1) repeats